jgi:DNA/RNA-binding domain of Phe-tRNA-synthetase-like protein
VRGESYEFNQSGQTIEVEDLLCVCRGVEGRWMPCGNPVKDSMETKVISSTTGVVAVIFAPRDDTLRDLQAAAELYAELLSSHCRAREPGFSLVGA